MYIKLDTGKAVKGRMGSWRPDGLSLQRGRGKVVSIDKSDIAQVALLIGRSLGRKAPLYAGLIAGSSCATLAGLAYYSSDWHVVPTAAVAAGAGVFWGGVAAGIAATLSAASRGHLCRVPACVEQQ